jgi:uncharacterized protein (DUF1800 family)
MRERTFLARLTAAILAGALAAPAPLAAARMQDMAAPKVKAAGPDKAVRPGKAPSWAGKLPITELSEDEAVLHALNRLAFGPRPGDIERVKKMGLEKWIEQQLYPESLNDAAVQARLARYPTLAMSSEELMDKFPQPQLAARRAGMSPEDYRKQVEDRQKQREERQQQMMGERPTGEAGDAMTPEARLRRRELLQGAGDPNMPPRGLEDVNNPARIVIELSMAKVTRAVYSERQLDEVLADFWFNHFNVFAAKGADRWLLTEYERESIRPYTLGRFRDMLGATAKSPAMLFYLDNWMSADPVAAQRIEGELNERRARFQRMFGNDPEMMERMRQRGRLGQQRRLPPQQPGKAGQPGQPGQPPPQMRRRGLNENYARELMELHTLGVDGGYSQQDIIEVARAFTGWTMRAPRLDPEFYFEDRIHDTKAKTVLGKKIDAGGMKDGELVLDMLAKHPNTAKFISTKLARRFVNDAPPAALVERMAQSFTGTDGDIRSVVRTMVYSPEFWARTNYRAKIKRPFELVVSTARALDAQVDVSLPLVTWSGRIGEPLYQCQPPTGYSDKAEAWVNTGALLNRLNFALSLAGGRLRGVRSTPDKLLGTAAESDAEKTLARAIETFLAGQVSAETRATLEKQMNDPQVLRATPDDMMKNPDAGIIAGLVLGTPEFQRR